MRWNEITETVWNTTAPRYDSKPAYMVPMDDVSGDETYPVWVNPSRNTFHKILEHLHGEARAIIYPNGTILIWDQPNLYHSDVYDYLASEFGGDLATLTCGRDFVAVKGHQETPEEFTDPEWLLVLQRAFARYYPNGVRFEQYNWF